jgi:hypothetical protein
VGEDVRKRESVVVRAAWKGFVAEPSRPTQPVCNTFNEYIF